MTLVAHYKSFGVPTLIGDLLVSGPTDPGRPVHIPAARSINECILLPANTFIAGLNQKVVLCSDKLAVAWSGSRFQAANVFDAWQPLRHMVDIDPQMVESLVDGIEDSLKNELSLIIAVALADGVHLITRHVEQPRFYGDITDVVAAGSGMAVFHELMVQQAATIRQYNPGASDEVLRLGFDANLVGSLFGEEFLTPVSLLRGWGGGFEIAQFRNGAFVKIGGQLYLNFFAERADRCWALWFVPNFRHVDRWREQTIVQAIEHQIDTNGIILPGRRDIFVVPPPGLPIPDLSDFAPPELEKQDVIQSCILFAEFDSSWVYAASYEQPVLRYDAPANSSRVRFSFDEMYMTDLIEGLQRKLDAPVRFAGVRNRPG